MIAGYIAALLIGLTLGLIGGGGSILTVPVLVYLLRVDAVTATAYSLFIVGVTSLVGVYPKYRNQEVDLQDALLFGLPSLVSVFFTRRFIVPALPQQLWQVKGYWITKSDFLLLAFALIMIIAAFTMIRGKKAGDESFHKPHPFVLPFLGLCEGFTSGLVGAGGGFLIIPALVLLGNLPMKKAVGTSLLIIAVKSLLGFTGDLGHQVINWGLLLTVTALAVGGVLTGNRLSREVPSERLKKWFGWFVLLMGCFILWREGQAIFLAGSKK
ncbi:sulfite exporter TauE/SafE family protein [Flavihumibacter petaseus]|uniref:Probable membrane transporter protein n=1 Tax=Flavihumibacter petaseus NBRC 106054 TaxID=1220578 RepID=A0A0E9MUK8_9BACT|nr:sulfite exporter TauE/SafE family protein [Flavihumibacter petaseus]GAO41259.1 hypothetical protein FPE01S_01_02710 [Flavihumibacter petaseus NBRC 106054]